MASLTTLSEYLTLQGCQTRSTKRLTGYLDQSRNSKFKNRNVTKIQELPEIFYPVSAGGSAFLLKQVVQVLFNLEM